MAPQGFALNTTIYTVTISGESAVDGIQWNTVANVPQSDPPLMVVGKIDSETTANMPQGSASLEGAEFTIKYYDGYYNTADEAVASGDSTRAWVLKTDANGRAALDAAYFVSGDDFYYMSTGDPTIPLGTLTIQETKAPEGYLLGEQPVYVQQVTPEGYLEIVATYNAPEYPDDVKRGDIDLIKIEDGSHIRMAGIPFSITSVTTGESHVVVTDENGYFSTASAWNAHSYNTNANDTANDGEYDCTAGVWFGELDALNDDRGALIYDTYVINCIHQSSSPQLGQ